MSETTHQDDSNGDDQLIEGETATVTVNPFGSRRPRTYEVEAGVALGTIKQDGREKAREDGLDVFHVSKVNGKFVDDMNGGFYEIQPEDQSLGGESA
ncbi:hypothetical protein [Halorussus amylolyticus]|uniref:hypothetical protein n=1 Tax=Halorussus amylolyticus TaxID=1126242 RepID=UPI001054044E|nr:hypothetical protein [Halorussus amylolyticus]